MEKYSEYRLGTYLLCPRKYYYTYIDKKKKSFTNSPNFVLGGVVHEACKDFYALRAEERTEENLYARFRSIWKKNNAKSFFDSVDDERAAGLRGLAMLENFFRRYGNRKPFLLERYMEHQFDTFTLYGRVDRVDLSEENTFEIIDYKTTRYYDAPEEERMRQTLQLRVYALLMNSVERPVTRGVYYHMPDDEEDVVEFSHESVRYFGDYLRDLVTDIESEVEFAEKPGTHCRFCDFASYCDETRAPS